ncbi:hypothetical protein WJU23_21135 [Prosthecobacter sp. SYSU 5D2]|uniref:hypothetical protein n=1 Tax=Prosthecobacter sp. SYSU 5D2 TaxID=3134134 RepID=UPI0031FEC14C
MKSILLLSLVAFSLGLSSCATCCKTKSACCDDKAACCSKKPADGSKCESCDAGKKKM